MLNRTAISCEGIFLILALILLCVPAAHAQNNAEANYKAKCSGCHGPDGSGNTPAAKPLGVRDFHSPEVQKETVAGLADIISNGKNKMPKYSDKLKDPEIKDLAAYIHELSMKK